MLADARAMAFVGVSSLEAARRFYGGVLGLTIVSENPYALYADVGGVRVCLAAPPQVQPACYTVLGFEVPDAQATLHRLAAAGIAFEHYGYLGEAQAADGLWTAPSGTRVAWFKDPDGNLLSISDAAAKG